MQLKSFLIFGLYSQHCLKGNENSLYWIKINGIQTMLMTWLKCFIFFFMILPPNIVMAQEKALRIGTAEFPPFKYKAFEEHLIGVDTEIVELIFTRLGYKLEFSVKPWKMVIEAGARGDYEVVYSFTKNTEREKDYLFSEPLSTTQNVFFKLKSKPITWQTLADLHDMQVGYSEGYKYPPELQNALMQSVFKKIHAEFAENPELELLKGLTKNRFDLGVCELNYCRYLIRANAPKFNEVDFIDRPIGEVRTMHAGFPKKNPHSEYLLAVFNEELKKFIQEGVRQSLFKKYHFITPLK